MELTANSYIFIVKPVHEVFDAIVDPGKLQTFFVSEASGRLRTGAKVKWEWKDHNATADIVVDEVIEDREIKLRWPAGDRQNSIHFLFEMIGDRTKVSVIEDGWPKDDAGIAAYAGNTGGWANFMVCLKGFLEHGVNLREQAF